jgi:hypothetical protein
MMVKYFYHYTLLGDWKEYYLTIGVEERYSLKS